MQIIHVLNEVMFMVRMWKLILVLFFAATSFSASFGQSIETDASARLEHGKGLLDAGKTDEAIEVFNQVMESGSTPLAFYYRGMAFSVKGWQGLAIKDYTEAIKQDSSQAVYHARRGISRLSLGDVSEAILDLNKALELEPSSSSVMSFRSRALMMSGRPNQALEDVNRAIQINPSNSGFFKLRGDILTSTGNYDKAVNDYDRAIQINPGFAAAYNNRGIALAHINKVKEAVDDLNAAMDLASSRSSNVRGSGFPTTPW